MPSFITTVNNQNLISFFYILILIVAKGVEEIVVCWSGHERIIYKLMDGRPDGSKVNHPPTLDILIYSAFSAHRPAGFGPSQSQHVTPPGDLMGRTIPGRRATDWWLAPGLLVLPPSTTPSLPSAMPLPDWCVACLWVCGLWRRHLTLRLCDPTRSREL